MKKIQSVLLKIQHKTSVLFAIMAILFQAIAIDAFPSFIYAQEDKVTSSSSASQTGLGVNVNAQATTGKQKQSTTTATQSKGEAMSAAHQSAVSAAVLKLTEVAGKDRNIGAEIRLIAKEQATSSAKTADAMQTIEQRNGFKTFLIGTDYKNIGALRSEIVTTENHIERLIKARDKATSAAVKAEIDAQIKVLQDDKTKVDAFMKTNENKLNLLGWVVKLFK